jgi:hypothetical protein
VSAAPVSMGERGKISGAAIVGDGRSVKIDIELACAQLQERLAVDERLTSTACHQTDPAVSAPLRAPLVRSVAKASSRSPDSRLMCLPHRFPTDSRERKSNKTLWNPP